jgi:uncharacterized protein (DUF305 family)
MSTKMLAAIGAAAIAAFILVIALTSGDDDDGGSSSAQARETDGAFIAAMVPHHESAIEMGEVAEERAEHPEIKRLAAQIIDTQDQEIEQMEEIHRRIFGEPLHAMEGEHGSLGLPEHVAGMETDMSALERARPFDREFIDQMIPHHQGAIRMARVELARGQDAELQEIAEAIIEGQAEEIEQMNAWRTEWYGEPSPAGGVPAEDEEGAEPTHEEMGH